MPARIWIGAVGHRDVVDTPELRARIRETVREIVDIASRQCSAPVSLGVVTSAAEGADRVIADVVLAEADDAVLQLICPLPADDYSQDFGTSASLHAFERIRQRALLVNEGSPTANRDDAYVWASEQVVRQSDVLIAVWDGEPARGRGGTADAVGLARSSEPSVPLFHIGSKEPQLHAAPEAIRFHHLDGVERFNAGFAHRHLLEDDQGRVRSVPANDKTTVWFGTYLERSDIEALRCQRAYTLGTLVLFWGAFAAATVAAVHGTILEDVTSLLWAEAMILALLLGVLTTVRALRWHQRWLDYRALAEWCRCAVYRHATAPGPAEVALIGGSMQRNRHWLTRVREEVWFGCPIVEDPPDFGALHGRVSSWVTGQIDYHRRLGLSCLKRKRTLDLAVYLSFVVTLAAVLLHAVGVHHDGLLLTSTSLTFASVVLPSAAGAAAGVRANRDYQRNADRSRHAAADLTRLVINIEQATELNQLNRAVSTVSDRLMRENGDWFDVMIYHDPELHV